MQEKTIEALKWIAGVLNDNQIPYRIGGGLATHLYGSNRPVSDKENTKNLIENY